jgi:hypothetical protein
MILLYDIIIWFYYMILLYYITLYYVVLQNIMLVLRLDSLGPARQVSTKSDLHESSSDGAYGIYAFWPALFGFPKRWMGPSWKIIS